MYVCMYIGRRCALSGAKYSILLTQQGVQRFVQVLQKFHCQALLHRICCSCAKREATAHHNKNTKKKTVEKRRENTTEQK